VLQCDQPLATSVARLWSGFGAVIANTPRRPARYRGISRMAAPSSPRVISRGRSLQGDAGVRLAIRATSHHRFVAQGERALAEWPLAATVQRWRGRGRRQVLLPPGGLALDEDLLIRPALQPRIPAMTRDGDGRLGRLAALVCVAALLRRLQGIPRCACASSNGCGLATGRPASSDHLPAGRDRCPPRSIAGCRSARYGPVV
jgi:hypothetical protein